MSINNKQWLGLPLNLLWGYIAIAVFMTGDGFELAFLSHYIKALGFSPAEAFLYPLRPPPRCRRGFPGGGGNYHPAENDDDWLRAVVRIPRAVPRFRPGHANYALILLSTASAASPIRCSSTRLSWRLSITSKRQRQLGHRLVLGGVFHRHRGLRQLFRALPFRTLAKWAPAAALAFAYRGVIARFPAPYSNAAAYAESHHP
ncbi:hypothetical protein BANRA_05280 [Klebsiella pneumoniae]|nr:hypothetical protein BANRA_05280 [Klebsiella pneumoniae]